MEILHAIVLGIVQGLSEFLPISSSGHLELTRWLFGWDALDEDLETAFDVAVHLGTLVGAIAYLRRDVVMYVTAGFGPLRGRPLGTDGKVAWFLVASAVPAGIAGVVLKDQIADFDRIWMIAVMLIVFGLLLLVADRLPESKELEAFRLRDALAMGVGQALTEGTQYGDDAKQRNTGLLEYKLQTAADAPTIRTEFIEIPDPNAGPYGAKGLAEAPNVPTAAAIANGVAKLVGTPVRQLPMTAERVWMTSEGMSS